MSTSCTPASSLPRPQTAANVPAADPSLARKVGDQRPLHIGSVKLDNPAVQAALSGYSDWPMRVIARRMGAAYTISEVMLEQFVRRQKPVRGRTAHHPPPSRGQALRVTDEEHPVGGQLMGSDPAHFGPAALKLVEAGFDVIDINFGCPVASAMGGCRGGYHLSQPGVALEIVGRVRDCVPAHIPVTVKMRRGIDDTAESRDRFFTILDGAFERGVAAVTVHGRTVEQKYNGPSRWEFLRDVKAHSGTRTIIGSGDLFSAGDCLRMLTETGVNAVSIARGAIGNPWIFSQCDALLNGRPLPAPPTVREQSAVLLEHFLLAEECYGTRRCVSQMKRFGIKYARLHPMHRKVRDAFVAVKTPFDWRVLIDRWYFDDQPGQYPQVDETRTSCSPDGPDCSSRVTAQQ